MLDTNELAEQEFSVRFEGWGLEALKRAAEDCGVTPHEFIAHTAHARLAGIAAAVRAQLRPAQSLSAPAVHDIRPDVFPEGV